MSNTNSFTFNGLLARVTALPPVQFERELQEAAELLIATDFPALANRHVVRVYGRRAQKAQAWWQAAQVATGEPLEVLVQGSVYSVEGQPMLVAETLTFYSSQTVRTEAEKLLAPLKSASPMGLPSNGNGHKRRAPAVR